MATQLVRQRNPGDIKRMELDNDTHRKRPRGRSRIRWMDNIRKDTKTYGVDDQMTEDIAVWSTMVATVDTRTCTRAKVK